MDIGLTHETRGICLRASFGSVVTSGSDESGILWLTNTQIVILDSDHLWCRQTMSNARESLWPPQLPAESPGSRACVPLGPQTPRHWLDSLQTGRLRALLLGEPGWGHVTLMADGLNLNLAQPHLSWECDKLFNFSGSQFLYLFKKIDTITVKLLVIKVVNVYWNFLWGRHCSKHDTEITAVNFKTHYICPWGN